MIVISTKEARGKFSSILDDVESGKEIIITRRGKKVARITSIDESPIPLNGLKNFRKDINGNGESLSQTVIRQREEERY
ncbi:MAG: type II toxin-antitoxin system Phd/YefM family antitoxin [Desulfamplus sp.]|nr:type II toxin-antitoxin system Phd/YefM family antitoxin [Desulfamplus sp.]